MLHHWRIRDTIPIPERFLTYQNVDHRLLSMVGGYAREYCAARVALGLSHRRVGPRSDPVRLSRADCDAGPATAGSGVSECPRVGGHQTSPALDYGGASY